eukprot:362156-Chlamydomonas_euryale.AAC.10
MNISKGHRATCCAWVMLSQLHAPKLLIRNHGATAICVFARLAPHPAAHSNPLMTLIHWPLRAHSHRPASPAIKVRSMHKV